MINGLENSYQQLNGLQYIYADNITSNYYEDSTIGSYLTGITSNIQDQINLLSGETDINLTLIQKNNIFQIKSIPKLFYFIIITILMFSTIRTRFTP